MTLLLLVNPIYCFSSNAQHILKPASFLFVQPYTPLKRNDIATLQEIKNYLNDEKTGNIYVLASGTVLNSDLLKSLDKPYSKSAVNNLQNTHDVDLRDGFPTEFLSAKTVITTDPTQLHLAEGSQEVVRYLAEEIKDQNSYIGKHFRINPKTFTLDHGVKVLIYDKVSDFTDDELKQMADYYTELYPSHPELFKNRILNLDD